MVKGPSLEFLCEFGNDPPCDKFPTWERGREREREIERGREREREIERGREREREREGDRKRERKRRKKGGIVREKERERERKRGVCEES